MKKSQIAAIVVGSLLSLVSILPVILTAAQGYSLGHPEVVKVFAFPLIGVGISAIIVFFAFFRGDRE